MDVQGQYKRSMDCNSLTFLVKFVTTFASIMACHQNYVNAVCSAQQLAMHFKLTRKLACTFKCKFD